MDVSKITDTIPRAAVTQILQVLSHLDRCGGRSTFREVRLFLLKRSLRAAPSSQTAMYTVARDVLLDLKDLEFIQAGTLPRTQSQLATLSEATCELTGAGRELASLYVEKQTRGRAFDQLLLAWLKHHPYFKIFLVRLHQRLLSFPDVTSIKQFGADIRGDENLDMLARRLSEHCLRRLEAVEFPGVQTEAFTRAVGERVQDLGRATLSGLDAKGWVDAIQDKVILPATLMAEGLPFSDAVTLQYVLKAAKDFLVASSTSSHPTYSLRIVFPTCEFQPALAGENDVLQIIHHGKAFAGPLFAKAVCEAYDRAAPQPGGYADAYAVRALVCTEIQVQPKVFALCLGELIEAGPASGLTIYTELPFDPPPPGEDYVEVGRNRIGLLKLTMSNNGG
jgi:hypothetical protein